MIYKISQFHSPHTSLQISNPAPIFERRVIVKLLKKLGMIIKLSCDHPEKCFIMLYSGVLSI